MRTAGLIDHLFFVQNKIVCSKTTINSVYEATYYCVKAIKILRQLFYLHSKIVYIRKIQ